MKKLLLLFFLIINSTILLPQSPPDKPSGLKAEIIQWMGFKSIHLSWNSQRGRDIYFNVYRSVNDESKFVKFPLRMNKPMFRDKFVIPGNTYHYFVTALNKSGESSPSDTVSVELIDTTPKAFVYGTVTDEETGDPLHAKVDIVPIMGWSYRHHKTDSSGNYEARVNAGKYFISFAAGGYYHEFYNNVSSIFDAETVELNENDTVNISAELKAFSAPERYIISGRVTNNSGAAVTARIHPVVLNRGKFHHSFKGVKTDSLGYYELQVSEGDSIALFAMPFNRNYLPEFYDDKKDFAEADKFVVHGNLTNIDFVLEARPVFSNSITGKVLNDSGEGLVAAVTAFKLREQNSRRFTRTVVSDSLGNYKLENLNPGNYILIAVPMERYLPSFFRYDGIHTMKWKEADSVTVTETSQLIGFDFNLLPFPDSGFARITGIVKDANGKAVNGAMVYVMDENSVLSSYCTSDENGRFTVDNLTPGKYTIQTSKFNFESTKQATITLDYGENQQQNVDLTMTALVTTKTPPVEQIVSDYKLFQNYPNPFNPITTIKYHLAEAGMVSLKVYNLIGQELSTLVDSYKPAGEHTIEFNAEQLNSGIYFYKLTAGNKIYTRKMVVLK